jgi:hypothetical protein
VVVIYALRESRLTLLINGEMDTVAYTTPTPDNASPYVIMLMAGYIGAASSPHDMGKLIALQGNEITIIVVIYAQHRID